jgi:Lipid A 3-O-deacylase (PagL)
MIVRIPTTLALLLSASFISCVALNAQTLPPTPSAEPPPSPGRVGFEVAAGPAFESSAAGRREPQRAVLGVPTLTLRVASWFDYAVEGHFARHVTPVSANEFGIVPIAFRVHTGGRTQVHLSGGAGVVWSGLAGIHGLEQRQNYITQLGAGVARVRANGSAVSLETRFYHMSNDGAKPPNLGIEQISVLVGYRLPR